MSSKHQKVFDSTSIQYEFIATEADINKLQVEIDNIEIDPSTIQISANQVTENSNRTFISPNEKAQIQGNTLDIQSLNNKVTDLTNEISQINTTDENVKMNAGDVSGYLESKLDGYTIVNENNLMKVKTIEGLDATIDELNMLTGVTSNIQAQINSLTTVGNFTTSVETYADLMNIQNPAQNDMVIVIEDETLPNSPSSIYIFSQGTWTYSGKFTSGEIRDFTTNPIVLDTETTGVLAKNKYEKQNALETPFTDTSGKITASNTQEAILEVFQYSDNMRKQWSSVIGEPLSDTDKLEDQLVKYQSIVKELTDAISAKGVVTSQYEKLDNLAPRILNLPSVTVEGKLKKISKMNVTAPYTLPIVLTEQIEESDIATTILEYIGGSSDILYYNLEFDNSDSSDFTTNSSVIFDGSMKINQLAKEYIMEQDTSWTDEGTLFRKTIDPNDFIRIDELEVRKEVL